MKFDIKKIGLCFLIYYLVIDVIGEILDGDSISESLEYHAQPHIVALTISGAIIFFLYSLMSYTVFYKWHNKKAFSANLLTVIILSAGIVGFRYLIEEVFFRSVFGFGNYRINISLWYYLLDNFYYVFQYCTLGIIFYFWQYSKYKDERNNQLMIENQQMELDLLRSQTNPHFLFNTLNNIYALVHKDSNKALNAIEKLSLLLRYSLYKTKTLVLLQDEISQIKNFIDLESIRHKEPPVVAFTIKDLDLAIQVPQFILLPFVENAFKHGKLHSSMQPIDIKIKVENSHLYYEVTNEIEKKSKDKVGGLGLVNLKKRLELLYPERHEFLHQVENSIFRAQIKIPLQ